MSFVPWFFSLGNTFQLVPLIRRSHSMSSCNLCNRTQRGVGGCPADRNNIRRSTVLAHWWMQLFHSDSDNGGMEAYVSVWAAIASRSVGCASIPAVYGLSRLAFRSPVVSCRHDGGFPGIFLAQARHYTWHFVGIASSAAW